MLLNDSSVVLPMFLPQQPIKEVLETHLSLNCYYICFVTSNCFGFYSLSKIVYQYWVFWCQWWGNLSTFHHTLQPSHVNQTNTSHRIMISFKQGQKLHKHGRQSYHSYTLPLTVIRKKTRFEENPSKYHWDMGQTQNYNEQLLWVSWFHWGGP